MNKLRTVLNDSIHDPIDILHAIILDKRDNEQIFSVLYALDASNKSVISWYFLAPVLKNLCHVSHFPIWNDSTI